MERGRAIETELMPRLVVSYTDPWCCKWKKGKGFSKPNFELLPKPELALRRVRRVRRVDRSKVSWPRLAVLSFLGVRFHGYDESIFWFQVVVGRAFIESPQILRPEYVINIV